MAAYSWQPPSEKQNTDELVNEPGWFSIVLLCPKGSNNITVSVHYIVQNIFRPFRELLYHSQLLL